MSMSEDMNLPAQVGDWYASNGIINNTQSQQESGGLCQIIVSTESFKDNFLNQISKIDTFLYPNGTWLGLPGLIADHMSVKKRIDNSAGKIFEQRFAYAINKKCNNELYAMCIGLQNSSYTSDIIVSSNNLINDSIIKSKIINIIRSSTNEKEIELKITDIIGECWVGVSLKTYDNNECQITTKADARDYLLVKKDTNISIFSEKDFAIVNTIINNCSQYQLILSINTYDVPDQLTKMKEKFRRLSRPSTIKKYELGIQALENTKSKFTIRKLENTKSITSISLIQNRKLFHWIIDVENKPTYKVRYGSNQANPYQRGVWVADINNFTIVANGSYDNSNYFDTMLGIQI